MTKSTKPTMKLDQAYSIIQAPVITEKSTLVSQHNQVVFRVPLKATKQDIKQAVESIYKVQVTDVNTLRVKGKAKRSAGREYQRSDIKKAIVTLAEGQRLDVTTTA